MKSLKLRYFKVLLVLAFSGNAAVANSIESSHCHQQISDAAKVTHSHGHHHEANHHNKGVDKPSKQNNPEKQEHKHTHCLTPCCTNLALMENRINFLNLETPVLCKSNSSFDLLPQGFISSIFRPPIVV